MRWCQPGGYSFSEAVETVPITLETDRGREGFGRYREADGVERQVRTRVFLEGVVSEVRRQVIKLLSVAVRERLE
jgi:hypothetical protein